MFIPRIIRCTQNAEFWMLNLVVNMRFTNRQSLTLILLTWRIGWAPNNASKWQMGFNSEFRGLKGQWLFNCACCVASNVGVIVNREFESKREKGVIWLRNWQKCAFQFIIHHHRTFQRTQLMQFTFCTQIPPRLPLHKLLISCPRIVIRKKG
jgi:hypothetical protein